MRRQATGLRLGSPAVDASPLAYLWLDQFFGNCSGCRVDFITVHWYSYCKTLEYSRCTCPVAACCMCPPPPLPPTCNRWRTDFFNHTNGRCTADNMFDILQFFARRYQRPLWLTEFDCT